MSRELIDALRPALENFNTNEVKILNETLGGHFPDLSEKESIVCAGICYSVLSYDFSDEEMVIYYCLQVQNNKVFSDEDEVKRIIKGLWEKKIITYETRFITYRDENFICPLTKLGLSRYLDEEIVYCWRIEFERAVKGALCVPNSRWTYIRD